ncbi:hypothetical protein BZA05DRAFT_266210 [Tricharina praecox]|uniref:uncharacterized protein n=1 Tax=Tricharina praecox TaxID=43433 RepID=UPI00221FC37E|nr:uncharacterized protein BZA05DRAFT_266210 [Tricharina praecox]KAI5854454.1 hypothetical protein BZA05DRAFT_266210 [Tricharina praecox]
MLCHSTSCQAPRERHRKKVFQRTLPPSRSTSPRPPRGEPACLCPLGDLLYDMACLHSNPANCASPSLFPTYLSYPFCSPCPSAAGEEFSSVGVLPNLPSVRNHNLATAMCSVCVCEVCMHSTLPYSTLLYGRPANPPAVCSALRCTALATPMALQPEDVDTLSEMQQHHHYHHHYLTRTDLKPLPTPPAPLSPRFCMIPGTQRTSHPPPQSPRPSLGRWTRTT